MSGNGSSWLVAVGDFLEWMGKVKAGILLLIMTASSFLAFGVWVSNYQGLPDRLDEVELQQARHSQVIAGLQEGQEDLTLIREMVFQLYCDRFPDRCSAIPDEPEEGSGGEEDT